MKLKKLLKDFAASRFETKKVPLVFNFFLLFLVGILLALSLYSHLDKVAFRIENKIDLIAENQNQSTVAGDVTNLIFSYENKSGKQLNQATLTFNLPNSFELIGGSPSQKFDQKTITFNLGDLDINAKGAINLSGKFWAMPKTEQQIYSILTFIPEGNTAKRTKKINQLINISDSPLSLTIKATDWAFAGQPVTFYVTLENKSDNTINNLSLSHNLLSDD